MRLDRHAARAVAVVGTLAVVLVVVVVVITRPESPGLMRPKAGVAVSSPESEESNPEAEELVEGTEARLEALAEARRVGTLGITGPLRGKAAPGWVGETVVNPTADDWEPAIAADPNAPYVYELVTRFGVPPCKGGNCPDPAIMYRVSKDAGKTFGKTRYICVCRRVQTQYDPQIEVVPQTGDVYAAWMNDWNIHFSKSTDHGATWSVPVPVYGNVSWGDKPALTTSPDGRDVYVSFNGPTGGDVYVAASHDAGSTWTQTRVTDGKRYYFAYQGFVAPDGRVTFAETSETYAAPGGASEGPVYVHAISSSDRGATWTDAVIDSVELGPPCTSEWCYADFYDGHAAIAGEANGDLVILYDGATTVGGPRTVWARSSTDGGATWSDRVRLSARGANAGFPAAVGTGDGGVRAWFADERTGRWNTWYRASSDLGASWSKPLRISDVTSGTAYKDADGYLEFYGDYGEIAITDSGRTVAIWGEGISYRGPGGCWYNRQR